MELFPLRDAFGGRVSCCPLVDHCGLFTSKNADAHLLQVWIFWRVLPGLGGFDGSIRQAVGHGLPRPLSLGDLAKLHGLRTLPVWKGFEGPRTRAARVRARLPAAPSFVCLLADDLWRRPEPLEAAGLLAARALRAELDTTRAALLQLVDFAVHDAERKVD